MLQTYFTYIGMYLEDCGILIMWIYINNKKKICVHKKKLVLSIKRQRIINFSIFFPNEWKKSRKTIVSSGAMPRMNYDQKLTSFF